MREGEVSYRDTSHLKVFSARNSLRVFSPPGHGISNKTKMSLHNPIFWTQVSRHQSRKRKKKNAEDIYAIHYLTPSRNMDLSREDGMKKLEQGR